jgi:catechol 2,3-dioxygenase-like lactoylglutathione lyase family enzyme
MSITRIGHLTMSVTDLDRSVTFAEDIIGLRVTERDADNAYLTSNSRHHQLHLTRGETHACVGLGLDVAGPDELDQVEARVTEAGFAVDRDRPKSGAITDCFWFDIPDGPTVQICQGVAGVPLDRYPVPGARPKKFGHATFAASDPDELERIFGEVLGFRVSDRIPGLLVWMRCNSDHHGIGIVKGDSGLNHYAFELEGWSAFEALADHMITRDVRFVWGPGRHGPGDNLFCYVEDADGSMCEFFSDIVQIEDESTYQPREWPQTPTSLNQWGPGPDPVWFDYSTAHLGAVRNEVAS